MYTSLCYIIVYYVTWRMTDVMGDATSTRKLADMAMLALTRISYYTRLYVCYDMMYYTIWHIHNIYIYTHISLSLYIYIHIYRVDLVLYTNILY